MASGVRICSILNIFLSRCGVRGYDVSRSDGNSQLVSHSHSASHHHEEIPLSLNQAESFFCLLYCMSIFICSQAVSLLAAVYLQPGRARAKAVIIPTIYFCLAAAAATTTDIHTAHWDSTCAPSFSRRPTIGTMEGGAGVHSSPSGRQCFNLSTCT